MRRLLIFFLLLMLPLSALCEEAALPATMREATSVEEVEGLLLMPGIFDLAGVEKGKVRYISQNEERDEMFRTGYWLGGEKGSVLDLTLTERYGIKFPFHAGVMCSRAVYSMALSCLGIDLTPGDMSRLMNARNLDAPYDIVSWKLGLERVTLKANVFNTMFENYLADERYSPIYLYFERPNGSTHAVLVVARDPDTGRFMVIDANPPSAHGRLYRVYFISLNKNRTEIINSTFREQLKGSKVLQLYQWRVVEPDGAEDMFENIQ